MSKQIWLNDPTILFKQDKLGELWPMKNMTVEEKVNAVTRLIIIMSLVCYLLTFKVQVFFIGIIGVLSTLTLYFVQLKKEKSEVEQFSNVGELLTNPLVYQMNRDNFQEPTESNPLMNVLIPEVHYNPKRKPAAPAFNPVVENKINKSVRSFIEKPFSDDKLFRNLGDEIEFDRSMLQFTATANTQVPNDQKSFQEFLYGDMISGKEGHPLALERTQSGSHNYTLQ